MLRWLVQSSLQRPALVLALALALVVYGAARAPTLEVDVFPEFAPPRVEIQTEAPGLSSEEVEELVTARLEAALGGVPFLATLRSKSVLGLSSVVLIFEDGTDLLRARQVVQERLVGEVQRLPAVALPPVVMPPLSSLSRVLKVGLSSDSLSQGELSELARWTIRPRLMAVQGVANVAIWGQRDPELQVLVDPERLRLHEVPLEAVVAASRDASQVVAGGYLDTPNQRLAVRQRAQVRSPQDLAAALIWERDGLPVSLGDVADVVSGHPPPIGDAVIDSGRGILLIVEKQPWGNTLEVTRGVEAALEALRPGLSGVQLDSSIFRPATFIERALANLAQALGTGCALVVLVLILFLAEWRTAVISVVAIPLSLVAAVLALTACGLGIDTMVLAGLVIAVGEVVDDAVIDVENITRRLRLEALLPSPRSALAVVLSASLEVRSAVVYASLIVSLVFLPVLFLGGLAGTFFRPLALAYVLAILSSLLVALSVTPAMCLLLLPGLSASQGEPILVSSLKRLYRRVLPALVRRPRVAGLILLLTLAVSAGAAPFLGEEFLPDFQERNLLMHWVEPPGTSLEASARSTALVARELAQIPGVQSFGSHIGRAETADEVVGPDFTELWIGISPEADYEATLKQVQSVVDGYPGLRRDVLTYLRERVKEVLSGAGATLVIRLSGPDLAVLRERASALERSLTQVSGLTHLQVEAQVLVPQVEIEVDPRAAALYGLGAGAVQRSVATLVQGTRVGQLHGGGRTVDVAVRGVARLRCDPLALQGILIDTPSGGHVRLGAVATIRVVPAPNAIKREAGFRRIDVTCNVSGRDLGSAAREVEERVRSLELPREYQVEVLGEYAERQAARGRLLGLSALSFLGILLLLQVDFRSPRLTALLALSFPSALVGGVAAVFATGGVVSIGSLVGMVTVLGIAARNGIMLVSHYRHLEREEGVPFGPELILRGAEERLAPILMTALCAGLALLPILLQGLVPGHEIEHPMAAVIVGGLISSTLLNLLLLPSLYGAVARPAGRA